MFKNKLSHGFSHQHVFRISFVIAPTPQRVRFNLMLLSSLPNIKEGIIFSQYKCFLAYPTGIDESIFIRCLLNSTWLSSRSIKNELDVTHISEKANIHNTSSLQSIHRDSQLTIRILMPSPILFHLSEVAFLLSKLNSYYLSVISL